jgi:hypothetical protein
VSLPSSVFDRVNRLGNRLHLAVFLPVNGFYTPLKQQIELAVQEGFIAPANMSLIEFVDLEDGDAPMLDWGKRGMEAVERWSVDVSRTIRTDGGSKEIAQ